MVRRWISEAQRWQIIGMHTHHAKRVSRCRSTNSGCLMTLLDLSLADFRRFLTVLFDRRLLGSQCCNRQPDEGLETQNTAYTPRIIQPTVPYGGGSVIVWGCISHNCKLDLVTIQGNLTGNQYIRDVLQPVVVPHFDNLLHRRFPSLYTTA
jgi:hypothetical protein